MIDVMSKDELSKDELIQTISRAIQILRSFSKEERAFSLAELHHKLGLSKSSLQRIMNTLVFFGFLEKDNEKKIYKLGMELYYLGKLVEEHSHLITAAKPYLQALRDQFGESVYLNIIENNNRKCIVVEEAKQELMTITYIGQASPLYAGASSKVLLAYLEPEKIQKYILETDLKPLTDKTKTVKSELLEELTDIKEKGYAISFGERVSGIFSISAPIFNRRNEVIAGLSISVPLIRVNDELISKFVVTIKEYVNKISSDLNF